MADAHLPPGGYSVLGGAPGETSTWCGAEKRCAHLLVEVVENVSPPEQRGRVLMKSSRIHRSASFHMYFYECQFRPRHCSRSLKACWEEGQFGSGVVVGKTDNKQTHTYNWGDFKMTNAMSPSKGMTCLLSRHPSRSPSCTAAGDMG